MSCSDPIAGIAADRAQAPAHAAFGFRPVDSFQGHLHEQRNYRERPDRDQSDRRGLPRRAVQTFSHEQTDPEAKGGSGSAPTIHPTAELPPFLEWITKLTSPNLILLAAEKGNGKIRPNLFALVISR